MTHLRTPMPGRWRRRLAAGMVSVFVALGVAACSTPAPPEKDLSAALVASGINKEVSACTAKALTTSLTPSELAEITERGAGGAPVDDPAKTGESADKLAAAMAKCRELQVAASPTTTTTLAPAGDGAGSSTTLVAPGTDGAQLNPASTTTPS